jgi:hypothetical protein
MKKILFLIITVLFCQVAVSQKKTIKVAVATNIDTTFSLVGNFSVRDIDVNLSKGIFSYLSDFIDTATYELSEVKMPEELKMNGSAMVKMPGLTTLKPWLAKLKNSGFDQLVFIYKPILDDKANSGVMGFSYGMTVSENKVFSINDAYIVDLETPAILTNVNMNSESDYIFRQDPKNKIVKSIRKYDLKDISKACDIINELNKNFALRICQKLVIINK